MSETHIIGKPVVIPYEKLVNEEADLNKEIEEAFGYAGYGLVVVSDIPEVLELRSSLLPLGTALAQLTDDQKHKIELPSIYYSVGWSHGKEKMKEGTFDTNKGSMYANPQYDVPSEDKDLVQKYPQDYHPNVWPREDLPAVEHAFKAFGRLMISVGEKLARHCDRYVASKLGSAYVPGTLEKLIQSSRTAKGRLLHYFPCEETGERTYDSWCGWHNDHSCLTALSSAWFSKVGEDGTTEIAAPDQLTGLYAKTRTNQIVKIAIPKNALAFQIGETSQILTGGILRATPHAVRAPDYPASLAVQRDTFAVFMQPNHDHLLDPPAGIDATAVAVGKWRPGQSYSQFSKGTIEGYYNTTE